MAVDDARMVLPLGLEVDEGSWIAEGQADSRRRYVTSLVRRRLHQRSFQERVLRAYREQCAFCRLRHGELLDAAHIVADREEMGEPPDPWERPGRELLEWHGDIVFRG